MYTYIETARKRMFRFLTDLMRFYRTYANDKEKKKERNYPFSCSLDLPSYHIVEPF